VTLVVYPGTDASCTIYEDDGTTFNYRRGEWMKLALNWDDAARRLVVKLAPGSRMLPPLRRKIEVRLAREKATRVIEFDGKPASLQL